MTPRSSKGMTLKLVKLTSIAALLCAALTLSAAPTRPTPPTRDPHTPGYATATDLADGAVPPADAEGNFTIGPTHQPAPEMAINALQGTV